MSSLVWRGFRISFLRMAQEFTKQPFRLRRIELGREDGRKVTSKKPMPGNLCCPNYLTSYLPQYPQFLTSPALIATFPCS